MKIGVLALQGDFADHIAILSQLKVDTCEVRLPTDLSSCDGLIIPGGESTTIGDLMQRFGLDRAILSAHKKGLALYGSCAGAILLSKEVVESDQLRLGLIDMSISRNAYGRQQQSFEATLSFQNKKIDVCFIRAPKIETIGKKVNTLISYEKSPVLVEQGRVLASTFHAELGSNTAVHSYFINKIVKKKD